MESGPDPANPDPDGDGFLDGYEVYTGKLPLDPLDKPALVAEARTAIESNFRFEALVQTGQLREIFRRRLDLHPLFWPGRPQRLTST